MSYVKPRSGTTASHKYAEPVSSEDFCVRLVETKGVMFTPGSALGMEGYVRIGYANNRTVLEQGLADVSAYLNSGGLVKSCASYRPGPPFPRSRAPSPGLLSEKSRDSATAPFRSVQNRCLMGE